MSKTTTRRAQAAERERRAVAMAAEGANLDTIAATLGYGTRSGAGKALRRGLAKAPIAEAENLRKLQNLQLDAASRKVFQVLDSPVATPEAKLRACDRLIAISARRSALNGLDAPRRTETTAPAGFNIQVAFTDEMETTQ